jgi:hypothetical protein
MNLRDQLFIVMKNKRLKQATGSELASVWSGLSPQEKLDMVQMLINSPEDFGRKLKNMVVSSIEAVILAEIDTEIAPSSIDKTWLESIFTNN